MYQLRIYQNKIIQGNLWVKVGNCVIMCQKFKVRQNYFNILNTNKKKKILNSVSLKSKTSHIFTLSPKNFLCSPNSMGIRVSGHHHKAENSSVPCNVEWVRVTEDSEVNYFHASYKPGNLSLCYVS